MTRLLVFALIMLVTAAPANAQQAAPRDATAAAVVAQAIDAMGGEAALRAIRTLQIDAMGHAYALEQSERPEGPYLVSYHQVSEIRDHDGGRFRRKQEQRNWSVPNWAGAAIVGVDGIAAIHVGEQWRPHQPQQLAQIKRDMDLAPERLLFTAQAAADLRVAPGLDLHGIPNRALAFTHDGQQLTLYLNSHTSMPTMLRSVDDDVFGIWGSVTRERWYTFWTLQPGGWRYPQQITTTWNGLPFADQTVLTLRINEPIDQAQFAVSDDAKAAFRKALDAPARPAGMRGLTLDVSKAIKVTPDVVVLPGAWAVTLVRQADGIVVLEAPIGSAYSAQVIDAASKIFPVMAIKAVVTTSDAWPHLGGVREYVARGIPVYTLDLNLPILERLVAAKYDATPDALARAPQEASWRAVSSRTTIGEGATRVELVPVRGEGSERMMMAYLPALNLLYASDLLQYNRDRTSFFNPVYPAEALDALEREDITGVDRVWAMHMDPIPWSKVIDALAAIRGRQAGR
jgi:hypothetical protein